MNRHNTPTTDRIKEALDTVADHEIPGTPPVWALKILARTVGTPITVHGRTFVEFDLTPGNPRHGEKRSDDHIGHYKLRFDRPCSECHGQTAVYEYNAYHHIAGSEYITCDTCGHEYHGEEWS